MEFLDQVNSNIVDESAWYQHCLDRNIPYIINKRRSIYGDVQWDYITMNGVNERFLYSQQEFIIYEIRELLKCYLSRKSMINIGSLTGYIRNIPVELVYDFSLDVCHTLAEAYRRHSYDIEE